MSNKTSIVIVGGGFLAISVAKALDKRLSPSKHSLTMITETDYYRHLPAALRIFVTAEGDLDSKMYHPHDKIFGKGTQNGVGRVGTVQVGKVVSVEEESKEKGYVVLEDGQRIEWNVLLIATGSEWEGPLRWPNRLSLLKPHLDTWRERIASAKSIVLVGGGAVGTEVAGELARFIPPQGGQRSRGPGCRNSEWR